MTTLKQPKNTNRDSSNYAQSGDTSESRQSQQQQRDEQYRDDQNQASQEETFTVSSDDWFKA